MKLLVLSDLHNEFEPLAVDTEIIAQADTVVCGVTSTRRIEASSGPSRSLTSGCISMKEYHQSKSAIVMSLNAIAHVPASTPGEMCYPRARSTNSTSCNRPG